MNSLSCDNLLSECLDNFSASDIATADAASDSDFCSRWRTVIRPVIVRIQQILSFFPRGRELARVIQVVINFVDAACPT